MPSLGSIFVDLLLDDAKFVEGTKRGSKGIADFQKSVKKAADAAALAIAGVTTAFAALLVRQAHIADATNKTARSLGIATQEFQALNLVADEAGVQTENLAALIGKAQKSIVAVAQGGSAKAFDAIGVSVKDILNLRPDKQFEAIAVGLSKIENPTTRNALAMQIFGKSGRDVINMLENFGQKIEEARAFNDKFNISLSDIDGRKIEEANDTFARLEKAAGGFLQTIAVQLAPAITQLSNDILNAGVSGKEFNIIIADGLKYLGQYIDSLRILFAGFRLEIDTVVVGLSKLIEAAANAGSVMAKALNVPSYLATGQESALGKFFDDIAARAKNSADVSTKSFRDTSTALQSFQTTAEYISKAQAEAQKRATEAAKVGGPGSLSPDLTKDSIEAQKKLQELYKQNRTYLESIDAKTLKYHDTVAELKKLLDAHVITYQQYNQAIKNLDTEFVNADEKAKDNLNEMSKFAEKAAENIQQSLSDFLFDPVGDKTESMGEKFAKVLKRMAADAAAANIAEIIFGKKGTSGDRNGGLLGNLLGGFDFGSIFGGTPKFNGETINWNLPKFATGIDRVPMDMPAIIHKDETVLNRNDANAYRRGAGGNTYMIDARGADQGAVARMEKALLALAGPGVIERRVVNAQQRGAL